MLVHLQLFEILVVVRLVDRLDVREGCIGCVCLEGPHLWRRAWIVGVGILAKQVRLAPSIVRVPRVKLLEDVDEFQIGDGFAAGLRGHLTHTESKPCVEIPEQSQLVTITRPAVLVCARQFFHELGSPTHRGPIERMQGAVVVEGISNKWFRARLGPLHIRADLEGRLVETGGVYARFLLLLKCSSFRCSP